jgi:galactose mutarotase-like enzyme
MGGWGSGNRIRISTRDTVENYHGLDVRKLARAKCLQPGSIIQWAWFEDGKQVASISYRVSEDNIELSYSHRENQGDWTPVKQIVPLDRTPCNFGGHRYWFRCPGCHRRVAIIYVAGKYFLCRHCYGLTHTSSQEGDLDRLMRKARKIRRRLGASKSLFDSLYCPKPKHMHMRSFNDLRISALAVENKINHILASRLGIRV